MTMFSAAENNNRHPCGGYGGGGGGGYGVACGGYGFSGCVVGSEPLVMAEEDEFNTDQTISSKLDVDDNDDDGSGETRDEGWLQLSIGSRPQTATKQNRKIENNNNDDDQSRLVELELMPSSSNIQESSQITRPVFGPIVPEFRAQPRQATNLASFNSRPFLLQQGGSSGGAVNCASSTFPHHQEIINWGFRSMMPIGNIAAAGVVLPSPSSSSSYFHPRPFQLYAGVDMAAAAAQEGPARVDFRVVQPPRRPHSGVWFMLQASQNQEREPFLPQISKSYLRIKDGRMTIRLVIKYLVNKLRLEDESEVEITCKGQKLLPFLTLQHVRDNIWSNPRDFITLLSNSSTTHHIMVLHYARTPSN